MLPPPADDVRHLLTRRRLFKLGIALGGVAAVAGTGAAYVLWPRAPAQGRRVLSAMEAAFVAALADAYLPPGNPFAVPAAELDIVGGVDDYLAVLPASVRRQVRALFVAFNQWPRLSLSATSTFAELPRDGRVAVLRAFEDSGVAERRQLCRALRIIIAMPYFDDPRVLDAAGISWGCPVIP